MRGQSMTPGTGCGASPPDVPDYEEQEVPSGLRGQSMSSGTGCEVSPPHVHVHDYNEHEDPSGML